MDEARIHATPGACGGSTPELGLGSERVVADSEVTPFWRYFRVAGDRTVKREGCSSVALGSRWPLGQGWLG